MPKSLPTDAPSFVHTRHRLHLDTHISWREPAQHNTMVYCGHRVGASFALWIVIVNAIVQGCIWLPLGGGSFGEDVGSWAGLGRAGTGCRSREGCAFCWRMSAYDPSRETTAASHGLMVASTCHGSGLAARMPQRESHRASSPTLPLPDVQPVGTCVAQGLVHTANELTSVYRRRLRLLQVSVHAEPHAAEPRARQGLLAGAVRG
jgi:hypothetical protein